jgi:hypothetical protein
MTLAVAISSVLIAACSYDRGEASSCVSRQTRLSAATTSSDFLDGRDVDVNVESHHLILYKTRLNSMASTSTTSLHSIPAVHLPLAFPPNSPSPKASSSPSTSSVRLPSLGPIEDETQTSISSHLTKSHRRRLNPFRSHKVEKTVPIEEAWPDDSSALSPSPMAKPTQHASTPPLTLESSDEAASNARQQPLPPSSLTPTSPPPPDQEDPSPPASTDPHRPPVAYTLSEISEPPWSPLSPISRTDSSHSGGGIKLSVAVRRAGTVLRHGHPDGSNRKTLKVERKYQEAGRKSIELEEAEEEDRETMSRAERGETNGHERGTLGRLGNKLGVPGSSKGYRSGGTMSRLRGAGSHRGKGSSKTSPVERDFSAEAGPSSYHPSSIHYATSSYTSSTSPGSPLQRLTSNEPLISSSSQTKTDKPPDNFRLPPPASSPETTSPTDCNPDSQAPSSTLEIPLPSRLPSPASTPATRPSTPTNATMGAADPLGEGANVDPDVGASDRMKSLEERIDLDLVKSKSTLRSEAEAELAEMKGGRGKGKGKLMANGKVKGKGKGNGRESEGDQAADDGTVVWERLWENQRGEPFFFFPPLLYT